jgi:hypothetical protein
MVRPFYFRTSTRKSPCGKGRWANRVTVAAQAREADAGKLWGLGVELFRFEMRNDLHVCGEG